MKKKLAVLPFIGLLSVSSAASELEVSTGVGYQYGGFLGVQIASKTEFTKVFISAGWVGASAGFETTFEKNSKHSYGIVVGSEMITSEDGFAFATYNYHFNGFSNSGLVIGTGIGVRVHETAYGRNDNETSLGWAFNVGYKF